MILGASLLTARGIPAAGEYELRTSLAMLMLDRLGAGGSFTEFQALDFTRGVVEMGHDGPAHLAISARRPRCCAASASTTASAAGACRWSSTSGTARSPLLGLGQERDGRYGFVASEGEVVPGPLLQIGNTTSRVDFGCDPGEWIDAWSASGVGHHWALGTGHRAAEIAALAELVGLEFRQVSLPS